MELRENIKFSIIMPAYNAENYIGYAIESVLSQTYSNFELIIVNDGSIDKTESIIQQYSAQDQRIILVSQGNSGSAGAARNTALKYVTGDYIQMLDADDCFELNRLNCIVG
jgi:glycosyltransferase involved in cell wall biosynthesis